MQFKLLEDIYIELSLALQGRSEEEADQCPLSWWYFPEETSALPAALIEKPSSSFLFDNLSSLMSEYSLSESQCYELCRLLERRAWHSAPADLPLAGHTITESFPTRLRSYYSEKSKELLLSPNLDSQLNRSFGEWMSSKELSGQLGVLRCCPIRRVLLSSPEESKSRFSIDDFGFYNICKILNRIERDLIFPGNDFSQGEGAVERYERIKKSYIPDMSNEAGNSIICGYVLPEEVIAAGLGPAILGMRVRDVLEISGEDWLLQRGIPHRALSMLANLVKRALSDGQPAEQDQPAQKERRSTVPATDDLEDQYKELKVLLLTAPYTQELSKPLSTWCKAADKHMPQCLLEEPIHGILSYSYDELLGLPNVGIGKIRKVCTVLRRIASTHEASSCDAGTGEAPVEDTSAVSDFASNPTEKMWQSLCSLILESDLLDEPVGRFVESLQELPSTLWEVPLGELANKELAELQGIQGWGTRRIEAMLKVFAQLGDMIVNAASPDHLCISIRPRFIARVERWMHSVLKAKRVPTTEEILREFIEPILAQVANDGPLTLVDAARLRLGINTDVHTLEEIARALDRTKECARQYLVSVARILKVRWPEGQYLVDDLCDTIGDIGSDEIQVELVAAAFGLFYPAKKNAGIMSLRRAKAIHEDSTPPLAAAEGIKKSGREAGQGSLLNSRKGDEELTDVHIHEAIIKLLKEDKTMD
jgi:hypothetical protein